MWITCWIFLFLGVVVDYATRQGLPELVDLGEGATGIVKEVEWFVDKVKHLQFR